MRRRTISSLLVTTAVLVSLSPALVASAASVTVTRPSLPARILTTTRLTAIGHASNMPTRAKRVAATLTLSKKKSNGKYAKVKSVVCTLSRKGTRVNYTAKFGPLSGGRYSAKVKFTWTLSGTTHSATSSAKLFRVNRTWTVIEKDLAFTPSTLTVIVGDRIVFKNQDSTDHHVRIDGASLALQAPGDSVTWTAPRTGAFPYFCIIHPSMTGKITVK